VTVRIEVRGIPAPQGSKRHVGGGRMVESSKKVAPWRDAVRTETQRAMGAQPPMGGALAVDILFYMPRPKGHYRTGRNAGLVSPSAPARPCSTPDLDKLARACLDGLTEGGAWKDDGQVADLLVAKHYADQNPAGCVIRITQAEE
jgi:crossover junction endodeoxyribonuclease RusA